MDNLARGSGWNDGLAEGTAGGGSSSSSGDVGGVGGAAAAAGVGHAGTGGNGSGGAPLVPPGFAPPGMGGIGGKGGRASVDRADHTWAGLGSAANRAQGGAGTVAYTAPELLARMYRLFLPADAIDRSLREVSLNSGAGSAGNGSTVGTVGSCVCVGLDADTDIFIGVCVCISVPASVASGSGLLELM